MPLQIRRGTEAERQLLATVPQEGELIYITNTQQLFVGDGTNLLKDISPITGYTDENAVDAVGSALTGGTHSGITFTYSAIQDGADRIDATINPTQSLTNLTVTGNTTLGNTTLGATTVAGTLSVTGKLIADFNGSIYADDSTLLVDGVDSRINLDGTVKGNIIPDVTEAYDIGSSSLKFKDLYLSGSSLWLGAAQITSTSTVINLPAGSTIDGEVISAEISEEDAFIRDLQGSVFGDDSTLLVDGVNSRLTTGNIFLQTDTLSFNTPELLIGHETLDTVAQVVFQSTSADSNVKFLTITDGSSSGGIQFATSRTGIAGSEAAVQVDDPLGFQVAQGWDGSAHTIASVIGQRVDPNGSVGSGAVTGQIDLFTFTDGNIANSKGVVINRNGYVSINRTTSEAQATLDINGFAKLQPLSAAPGTLVNGLIAIDDGTTNWSGHASGVQAVVAYINTGWVKLNN